jgi:hypothetical protein
MDSMLFLIIAFVVTNCWVQSYGKTSKPPNNYVVNISFFGTADEMVGAQRPWQRREGSFA